MPRISRARRFEVESALPDLIEQQGLQQWQAAQTLGMSESWVQKACTRLGIKTQRTGPRGGSGHPNWKGGRMADKDGYITLWMPSHPNARKSGRILEHRLTMERTLGRLLGEKEVVHHKDGNKLNNHPDNLELFACNGDHLAHELAGRVPNWTPEGLAAIREALCKPRHYKPNSALRSNLAKKRLRDAIGRFVPEEG